MITQQIPLLVNRVKSDANPYEINQHSQQRHHYESARILAHPKTSRQNLS